MMFSEALLAGIPADLPPARERSTEWSHAPARKKILTEEERSLALHNALRYFPKEHHAVLAGEFAEELGRYGRIYMYRFQPNYAMRARPIDVYPAKCLQAAAIMLMIQNNLDPSVAQHPEELITYGGNGSVFQNWAQYLLTMQYLAQMTQEQTLVMYSGHPMGLFPSHADAPRVVVTNGMVIPNHSQPDDWERMNALGVSQYGQMTAGSYMYIGPQGIVHGTTITVLNAGRMVSKNGEGLAGKLFLTSGLGGMSGGSSSAFLGGGGLGDMGRVGLLLLAVLGALLTFVGGALRVAGLRTVCAPFLEALCALYALLGGVLVLLATYALKYASFPAAPAADGSAAGTGGKTSGGDGLAYAALAAGALVAAVSLQGAYALGAGGGPGMAAAKARNLRSPAAVAGARGSARRLRRLRASLLALALGASFLGGATLHQTDRLGSVVQRQCGTVMQVRTDLLTDLLTSAFYLLTYFLTYLLTHSRRTPPLVPLVPLLY